MGAVTDAEASACSWEGQPLEWLLGFVEANPPTGKAPGRSDRSIQVGRTVLTVGRPAGRGASAPSKLPGAQPAAFAALARGARFA